MVEIWIFHPNLGEDKKKKRLRRIIGLTQAGISGLLGKPAIFPSKRPESFPLMGRALNLDGETVESEWGDAKSPPASLLQYLSNDLNALKL